MTTLSPQPGQGDRGSQRLDAQLEHGIILRGIILFLRGGFGEVGEGFAALEFGVFDDTYFAGERLVCVYPMRECKGEGLGVRGLGRRRAIDVDAPASASLEKFPVQVTNVWPSCSPEVTG
jgi:hypothetical protein